MDTGFSFADLVDEAHDRAGGGELSAQDVIRVRRGLRILTERWTAQGFNTWRVETFSVGVSGGSPTVTLPRNVDDVIEINSVVEGVPTEGIMRRITASDYARLTSKMTNGRPSQWWLHRTECPQLEIFPIGYSDKTVTLNVMAVMRPAAFDRYNPEDDVPGRWLEALIIGLAHDLARKRPPFDEALISRLSNERTEAEGIAQRADRDRANYRVRIKV